MARQSLPTDSIETLQAKLKDEGKTAMIMAMDGKIEGIVAVADTVKEHSKEAIDELKKMGIEVWMITGDNERTASAIARQVGIEKSLQKYCRKIKPGNWKK
jgi:Cu+-exporting ATPase